MKRYGTLIALAVAVVFGIAAVFLANQWLSTRVSEEAVVIKEQIPLSAVVIVGKDLDLGSLLSKENLTMADWPKANVPKGAFTNIDDVVGRITVTKMVAGSPVIAAELAADGSGVGLVAMIDPGMRAMAIRVDEVIGVGGFIMPNTFVDVIHVEGKKKKATTILERIEVLAVAQETFVEEGKAKLVRTVTLELALKDAEKLAAKINLGPIHLVLRNPAEDIEEPPKPAPKKRVVRKYRPKPKPAPVPEFKVELIQGDKAPEHYKFKSTEAK